MTLLKPPLPIRQTRRLGRLPKHASHHRSDWNAGLQNDERDELIMKLKENWPFYFSSRAAATILYDGIMIDRKAVQCIKTAMEWMFPARINDNGVMSPQWPMLASTVPDQLWKTDITLVSCGTNRSEHQFNHVDTFTRQCLAYVLSEGKRRHNAVDRTIAQLMLRSEKCPQFTVDQFKDSIRTLSIKQELIHVNTSEQREHKETFHCMLKKECIWPMDFGSFEVDFEYIEKTFYEYSNSMIQTFSAEHHDTKHIQQKLEK